MIRIASSAIMLSVGGIEMTSVVKMLLIEGTFLISSSTCGGNDSTFHRFRVSCADMGELLAVIWTYTQRPEGASALERLDVLGPQREDRHEHNCEVKAVEPVSEIYLQPECK